MKDRILFFVKGFAPTDAQRKEAMGTGVNVSFRNAFSVGSDHNVEHCSAVMGEVPKEYEHFPSIDEYLSEKGIELKKVEKKTKKLAGETKPATIPIMKAEKAKPIEAPLKTAPDGDVEAAAEWKPN
jgi:hypothetical protein